MANTIQKNTILDGPRHAIVEVWLASDGATGELSDEVIVDVSGLSVAEGQTSISSLVVENLHYSTRGCSATLDFDRTTNQGIYNLPADLADTVNFKGDGSSGLIDNGSGSTGDVILNTSGFTASGDDISLKIKVRKKYTT